MGVQCKAMMAGLILYFVLVSGGSAGGGALPSAGDASALHTCRWRSA